MTENYLQLIAGLKIIWCGFFALLYGYGGISHKWLRRYCGAFWMGFGVLFFGMWTGNLQWFYFIYPVLLCASLHIGYGGDHVGVKLRKRAVYGLAIGVSALPLCLGSSLFFMFGIHCFLCILASVFLGVFNPARNARDEETLLAILSTIIPLFLI